MRRAKITVVGAGNVGASCALWAAERELGDIVLIDLPELADKTKGKSLDLAQCGPVDRFNSRILGTGNYDAAAGSDLVILTAGVPRKPGMSRDDLVQTNFKIVSAVSEQIARNCPEAIVIVVSNPLDAMVYTAWKKTGFAPERVMGQAGCLDVARFCTFIAAELNGSVEDVNALLLGGHGDDMVPLIRYTSVAGIPVTQLIAKPRLDEIVKLMGTSAYYAPAAATIQMAEAILRDKRRILPCAAYCDREYGVGGYFVGVPCVLGAKGVEKVVEVELDTGERQMFDTSVQHVRELVGLVQNLLTA